MQTPATATGPEADELRLAWRWFEGNRDRIHALDVDLAGGLEETIRLLARYLDEEPSGGKVIHT